MLLYNFDGYEGFKEIFGLQEHGNGVVSRKNRILLSFYKRPGLINWLNSLNIPIPRSMGELKSTCMSLIQCDEADCTMRLKEGFYFSPDYYTDEYNGIVQLDHDDPDIRIRYCRRDNDKVYSMKAGKMFSHLIKSNPFGNMLPDPVCVWLSEEFAADWAGYCINNQYTLHVDDDFERIYSSSDCDGNFNSCMTDKGFEDFYTHTDAKAAYITAGEDNLVVARAILFEDVTDHDRGRHLRLLERQYSKGGDLTLQKILVQKLISKGYIDGYKQTGAGCHDTRAFLDCDGNKIDGTLSIRLDVTEEDPISYQDSFKWYQLGEEIAWNNPSRQWNCDLAITTGSISEDMNWDEYHERYTMSDTVDVHVGGSVCSCSVADLDDFREIGDEWYHYEDICYCDECDEAYIDGEGYYSETLDQCFCCHNCMEQAERRWAENNDEYVYIEDYGITPVKEAKFCDRCGEPFREGDMITSEITGGQYCCLYHKNLDEREYAADHPDEYFIFLNGVYPVSESFICPMTFERCPNSLAVTSFTVYTDSISSILAMLRQPVSPKVKVAEYIEEAIHAHEQIFSNIDVDDIVVVVRNVSGMLPTFCLKKTAEDNHLFYSEVTDCYYGTEQARDDAELEHIMKSTANVIF